jgi:hypothetical protein
LPIAQQTVPHTAAWRRCTSGHTRRRPDPGYFPPQTPRLAARLTSSTAVSILSALSTPTRKFPQVSRPIGSRAIGNKLYVTYFNTTGQGGSLDVCDLTTNLTAPACRRLYVSLPLIPTPTAGRSAITGANPVFQTTVRNGPWGIALAPQNKLTPNNFQAALPNIERCR